MTMMIYSLPRPVHLVDAITVLPGQGEAWRLRDAIRAWQGETVARHLLVAGSFNGEKTWFLPTLENLAVPPYGLVRTKGVVIHPHADHSRQQADWIVPMVRDNNITSLALFVSPYHLLRAFLTILRGFRRLGVPWIPIVPMPVNVSPDTVIPETSLTAWEQVYGEVERTLQYQDLGDVAELQELQEYLAWLWQQPIFSQYA